MLKQAKFCVRKGNSSELIEWYGLEKEGKKACVPHNSGAGKGYTTVRCLQRMQSLLQVGFSQLSKGEKRLLPFEVFRNKIYYQLMSL